MRFTLVLIFWGLSFLGLGCQSLKALNPLTNHKIDLDGVLSDDLVTHSSVAILRVDKKGVAESYCSATLVSSTAVLSAAHCFANRNYHYYVLFSKNFKHEISLLESNMHAYSLRLSNILIHPSYSATRLKGLPDNDLAFVTLGKEAPAGYTAVPLIGNDDQIFESIFGFDGVKKSILKTGTPVIIAGFGVIDLDRRSTEGVLRKANSFVNSVLSQEKKILLGPHPGTGACPGDSGGSAYAERKEGLVLIGVLSEANCKGGGVKLVDIRQYSQWISQNLSASMLTTSRKIQARR